MSKRHVPELTIGLAPVSVLTNVLLAGSNAATTRNEKLALLLTAANEDRLTELLFNHLSPVFLVIRPPAVTWPPISAGVPEAFPIVMSDGLVSVVQLFPPFAENSNAENRLEELLCLRSQLIVTS